MTEARFGTAGNPAAFYDGGGKASAEMPQWLADQGLNLYEYQCSRGANVGETTARLIGEKAAIARIALSIHAPYYISLATEDPVTAENTRNHFFKTLTVAQWLGAPRVVFHIGGMGKSTRQAALERARRLFSSILAEATERGLHEGVCLLPETMGKQNQLGNLEEVLDFCQLADWVKPAVDFGHLHAVSGGQYTTYREFADVFDRVSAALGAPTAANLHIHFSKIEFTRAGEKRHWNFGDPYGPPHEPLLQVIADRGYRPWIVCESAGCQERDAGIMQELYRRLLKR